jgi:hypothetical protein
MRPTIENLRKLAKRHGFTFHLYGSFADGYEIELDAGEKVFANYGVHYQYFCIPEACAKVELIEMAMDVVAGGVEECPGCEACAEVAA